MVADDARILSWLAHTIQPKPSVITRKRKLAARRAGGFLSPPPSCSDETGMMKTSVSKRRRQNGEQDDERRTDNDNDPTPKARRRRSQPPASSSSSCAGWTAAASSRSSSPRKEMASRHVSGRGHLERLQLDESLLPPAAQPVISTFERISKGIYIIPATAKPAILESELYKPAKDLLWQLAFAPPDPSSSSSSAPATTAPFPPPDRIAEVIARAEMCFNDLYDEAGWNILVHGELLSLAIPYAAHKQAKKHAAAMPSLCTIPCHTARISPEFSSPPADTVLRTATRMVDFCLALRSCAKCRPDGCPSDLVPASALEDLRERLAGPINHAPFTPFGQSPIVVPVETKRSAEACDKAQLQVGRWHAAQWRFLRATIFVLLTHGTPKQQQQQQHDDADETANLAKADQALAELGVLPALIVQGHSWHLALSTFNPQSTVTTLWTDIRFGSTQTVIETYQVLAGLRALDTWARDTYLPWYKRWILFQGVAE